MTNLISEYGGVFLCMYIDNQKDIVIKSECLTATTFPEQPKYLNY